MEENRQQSSQFVPMDKLLSQRDMGLTDENEAEIQETLDMGTEELRLLGFQLAAPGDLVGKQRPSQQKLQKKNSQSTLSINKNYAKTRSAAQSVDTGNNSEAGDNNSPVLQAGSMQAQMDKMTLSYNQRKEQKLRAVSVRMTPEEIKQIQLHKLYAQAQLIQKARVRDMMTNLLVHRAGSDLASRFSLFESFVPQDRQADMIELTEANVNQFFHLWNGELNELPLSFRTDIMKLSRPRTYSVHEKVISFEEQQQNMYLIVEGSALLFQNQYSYQKFQKRLETVSSQQNEKAHLVSRPNFSSLVHVGTLLIKFVQKSPLIQHIINKGRARLEAKHIEDRIGAGEAGFTKLTAGSTFGDFQEAKGRVYKPNYVVAMSETLKVIVISNKDIRTLFAKILTPENINLVRGRISSEILTQNVVKKIARCFNEKEFPAGKILIEEGSALKMIYILKSGTCEVYSKQNPLKAQKKRNGRGGSSCDEEFFLKLPMSGDDMCLGLKQGYMSSAFNYYPLSQVGAGSWLGEESFFMNIDELNYSIKCLTPVKVLEIGLVDFQDKMPYEMLKHIQSIALQKQFLKIVRMKEIAQTAQDLKQKEQLHKFHQQTLKALVRLHPHATKRIVTGLGNQFQMEGYIRTVRQKDAINIGQIQAEESSLATSRSRSSIQRQQTLSEEEKCASPRSPRKRNQKLQQSPTSFNIKDQVKMKSPRIQIPLEKQTTVQAMSPSGKHLNQEMSQRQILIDRKLQAYEEANYLKFPNHIKNIQTRMLQQDSQTSLGMTGSNERLPSNSKQSLLRYGLQDNNELMLSLTTINGRPINRSPSPVNAVVNEAEEEEKEEDLMYEPTQAQIAQLQNILNEHKRNPIMEMREQARYSEMSKNSTPNSNPRNQVVRSITFFNTEKAQKQKEKEENKQKQVFRLADQIERFDTIQPRITENDFIQNSMTLGLRQYSSKQLLDSSYIPDSSNRIPNKRQTSQNPFVRSTGVGIMQSQSSAFNAKIHHSRPMSLILKTGQLEQSRNSAQKRYTLKQSFLYQPQRVSNQEILNSQQYKMAIDRRGRHHLNRSLQFTTGNHHHNYNTFDAQQTILNYLPAKMMNQNSSKMGIDLPAAQLFDEEQDKILSKKDIIGNRPDKRMSKKDSIIVGSPRSNFPDLKISVDKRKSSLQLLDHKEKQHNINNVNELSHNDSNVFNIDLSRVSQMGANQSESVLQKDQEEKKQQELKRLAFERDTAHELAHSKLVLEMLKDEKQVVDPLSKDPRFDTIRLGDKPDETKTKKNNAFADEVDGAVRYIEPEYRTSGFPNNLNEPQFETQKLRQQNKSSQQVVMAQIGQVQEQKHRQEEVISEEATVIQDDENVEIQNINSVKAEYLYTKTDEKASYDEYAYEEYLQLTQKILEEDDLNIDDSADNDPLQINPITSLALRANDSSSSHASVLEAIDRTVSMYETFPRDNQTTDYNQQEISSAEKNVANIAVLSEMLSARQKIIANSGKVADPIKAFKSGKVKLKNLKSLDTTKQAYRLVSPRQLSPKIGALLKYQSLKSPGLVSTVANASNYLTPSNILRSSLSIKRADQLEHQVQQVDKYASGAFAVLAQDYFAHTNSTNLNKQGQQNSSGMHITQLSLDLKPDHRSSMRKSLATIKQKELQSNSSMVESNMASKTLQLKQTATKVLQPAKSQSPANSNDMNDVTVPSQFQKPNPKFATLATKSSQKSSTRRYGGPANLAAAHSGRNSPLSPSHKNSSIPNDLDVVMDGSDLNFKKKKAFGVELKKDILKQHVKPSTPTNKVQVDVEQMNKTTMNGETMTVFPKIVFEETKRVQGTADYSNKAKEAPPDSAGTKYFLNSNEQAEAGMMGVTFSKDGAAEFVRRNSGGEMLIKSKDDYDQDSNRLPAVQGQHTTGENNIIGGAADLNDSADSPKIEKISKIKVAIENTSSAFKQLEESELMKNTAASRYLNRKVKLSHNNNHLQTSTFANNNRNTTYNKGAKRFGSKNLSPRSPKGAEGTDDDGHSPRIRKPRIQYGTLQASSPRKHLQEHHEKYKINKDQKNTGKKKGKHYMNDDLNRESVLVHQSENPQFRTIDDQYQLRKSEMSLINNVLEDSRVKSLLGEIDKEEHFNLNSQPTDQINGSSMQNNQHYNISANKPETTNTALLEPESTWFKHMPASLYKNARFAKKATKVPIQNYLDTMLEQNRLKYNYNLEQQSPQKSSLQVVQSQNSMNANAFKESNYIKNQKRTREGKIMLMEKQSTSKYRTKSKQDDARSTILGRSSIMRRSLILPDRSNPSNFFNDVNINSKFTKNAGNDTTLDYTIGSNDMQYLKYQQPQLVNDRQDSVLLMPPNSYSRVLQRSSQPGIERISQQSLNSTKLRNSPPVILHGSSDHEFNQSQLRLERTNQMDQSAAELLNKRFQQIKEEKRRMQQI